MGLPWIKVAVDSADHPKMVRLAGLLGISHMAAFGHVVRMWAWFGKLQPDGCVREPFAKRSLTLAGAFANDPETVVAALLDVELVDALDGGGYVLHDWSDLNGAFVKKAEGDRERARRNREKAKKARESAFADGSRSVRGAFAERSRIVSTQIEIETETEKEASSGADAPAHEKVEPTPSQKKPRKVADTRHAKTIATWCRLWSELHGGVYQFGKEKDGSAISRLLGFEQAPGVPVSDAEIEARMRRALSDSWFRERADIALFVSQWNRHGTPTSAALIPQKPKDLRVGRIAAEDVDWSNATRGDVTNEF
jgi:hypothetical protein